MNAACTHLILRTEYIVMSEICFLKVENYGLVSH